MKLAVLGWCCAAVCLQPASSIAHALPPPSPPPTPLHCRPCISHCLQVGKPNAHKPALSLDKERLLREGITTLGAFSKKYIKPVPAPAAKGGESAPAQEAEGAKLADGGPARSKQRPAGKRRRRTAMAAPAMAGGKRRR